MDLTFSNRQYTRRHIVLLAPSLAQVPEAFTHARLDPRKHEQLLSSMQRLRGTIYQEDGAISASALTPDGRHKLDIDERSWHLLTLDKNGDVSGCSRYLAHSPSVSFSQLELTKSALATSPKWGRLLRSAIDAEIALARKLCVDYVELGGWALSHELRCTTEALRIALGTYTLANLLGHGIGVSTATVRNCSASILKRLGGVPVTAAGEPIPSYYDPQYKCDMEILRFDSRSPAARFQEWIERLSGDMVSVPVVCAQRSWQALTETCEDVAGFASLGAPNRVWSAA